MTDFSGAGNPGEQQPTGNQPNFQQAGGANQQPQGADDNTVVLELDGRKFTKTDLIKKITHADQHISTLTGELQQQRELLNNVNETLKKQVTAAELLAQVKQTPAAQSPVQEQQPQGTQQQAPTAEEITQQVMSKMQEARVAEQRQSNWDSVTATLTQVYGDTVNAKVAATAAEAGLTLEQAAELARSNPKVFLKLFPETTVKGQPSALANRGSVNSQSFRNEQRGPSGWNKAQGTKAQTEIYLTRLKELGL